LNFGEGFASAGRFYVLIGDLCRLLCLSKSTWAGEGYRQQA
jgi:hypothetical protein